MQGFGMLLTYPRITQLMFDFLEDPDNFYQHVRRVTASIACTFVFGHRAPVADCFWGNVRAITNNKCCPQN